MGNLQVFRRSCPMKRLIVTYNQSCNLTCKFCYIDFHHQKVDDKVLDIVKKAVELEFEVITFGGGDPFSKKSFAPACRFAKEQGLFVQVDTNAKAIKEPDFNLIAGSIDLLGISIDAYGEDYDDFRESKSLFKKVDAVIKRLHKESNTPIKINTIVTKTNKDKLLDIQNYILTCPNVVRWSLYQFFPLSFAASAQDSYEISDEDFDKAINSLEPFNIPIQLEAFKFSNRVNGYLFCDEEGRLYTNNIEGEYVKLFSIFDRNVKEEIDKIDELINPLTQDRYK